MNAQEYGTYARQSTFPEKARWVVVPSFHSLTMLRGIHRDIEMPEMRVSDCITEDAWLPMPNVIFDRLRTRAAVAGPCTVVGLSGYMTLLSTPGRRRTIELGRQWLDDTAGPPAVFLIPLPLPELDLLDDVFANPRYKSKRQLIRVEASEADEGPLLDQASRITLVDRCRRTCVPAPVSESFQAYLRKTEEQPDTCAGHKILVSFDGHQLAGLHAEIRQLMTARELADAFFDIRDPDLSDSAIEWMVNNGRAELATFFKTQEDLTRHFLRVFDHTPDTEQEILLWVARQHAPPESYLAWVLHDTPRPEAADVRHRYVTAAAKLLDKTTWTIERHAAINQAGRARSTVDIQHFICECMNESTARVAPWLNCGSASEKAELLRRCAEDIIVTNATKVVYPELANYMRQEIPFGSHELDAYFTEYRALKMTDRVTQEFFDIAYSTRVPAQIPSRDALVQEHAGDADCALLVVDACGAEYLPMLVAMAREQRISMVTARIATAHLPTATDFNIVIWPDTNRRLQPNVQRLDNVAHHGREAHEEHSSAENLVAELSAISDDILPRVLEGLARFERVLVTADHGSSRLAVLAAQKRFGLARKLDAPVLKEPESRRYCSARGGSCPAELEESFDGAFWAVRGYNKLSKQGGQGFCAHGGASLEERLVPVIVFSRGPATSVIPLAPATQAAEIVEDVDFDI